MKRIAIGALLALTLVAAQAQHGHRPHGSYWHPRHGWVFPTMIGGIIGYEIARSQNQPVVVQQPPIIVTQPAPPGPITNPPVSYRVVEAWDPSCTCFKQVFVPNY
jgi:hypothetical protein